MCIQKMSFRIGTASDKTIRIHTIQRRPYAAFSGIDMAHKENTNNKRFINLLEIVE